MQAVTFILASLRQKEPPSLGRQSLMRMLHAILDPEAKDLHDQDANYFKQCSSSLRNL